MIKYNKFTTKCENIQKYTSSLNSKGACPQHASRLSGPVWPKPKPNHTIAQKCWWYPWSWFLLRCTRVLVVQGDRPPSFRASADACPRLPAAHSEHVVVTVTNGWETLYCFVSTCAPKGEIRGDFAAVSLSHSATDSQVLTSSVVLTRPLVQQTPSRPAKQTASRWSRKSRLLPCHSRRFQSRRPLSSSHP